MRLIDADELLEKALREGVDTRERVLDMIRRAPLIKAQITLEEKDIQGLIAHKFGVSYDDVNIVTKFKPIGVGLDPDFMQEVRATITMPDKWE